MANLKEHFVDKTENLQHRDNVLSMLLPNQNEFFQLTELAGININPLYIWVFVQLLNMNISPEIVYKFLKLIKKSAETTKSRKIVIRGKQN